MSKRIKESKKFIYIMIGMIFLIYILSIIFVRKISNFIWNNPNIFVALILLIPMIFLVLIITISCDKSQNKKEKSKEIYRTIELLLTFSTVLILLFQGLLLFNQTNLMKINSQILEESSISTKPEVLLVSSQGYRCYKLGDYLKKEGTIGIGITNIGKALIPSLYIEFIHQEQIAGMLESDHFRNLKSLDYNFTIAKWSFHQINVSEFEFGKRDLIFEVICPVCKSSVSQQKITICIYNQSKKECGEDWEKNCK